MAAAEPQMGDKAWAITLGFGEGAQIAAFAPSLPWLPTCVPEPAKDLSALRLSETLWGELRGCKAKGNVWGFYTSQTFPSWTCPSTEAWSG